MLFGFYPILLLQHLQEVVDPLLLNVRLQFSRYLFNCMYLSWSFWGGVLLRSSTVDLVPLMSLLQKNLAYLQHVEFV
jgi:hypothetical protein